MRTAVDTNVFSALWSAEPLSAAMSDALEDAAATGALVICAVVYAELLAHPRARPDFVDRFLTATDIAVDFTFGEPVWWEVAAGLRNTRFAGVRPVAAAPSVWWLISL